MTGITEVKLKKYTSMRRDPYDDCSKKSGREFDLPPQHESVESLNSFANVMFVFDYAKIK